MSFRYANIIVDISHEKIDRPFQYKIPPALSLKIEVGSHVKIPFGKGNKLIGGYVTELTDEAEYPQEKLKEIAEVVEKSVQAETRQIKLAAWMKEHYGSTMITALKTVLPVKRTVRPVKSREVSLGVSMEEAERLTGEFERKHQVAKVRLMTELMATEQISYGMITSRLGVSSQTLKGLKDKGIIRIETFESYRTPVRVRPERKSKPELTNEQREVTDAFLTDYRRGERNVYLLHGVTGSGKTEVYMRMIEEVCGMGRQAIVLIPEIALTYQTLTRFYGRFGEKVSVIHSRLSAGERYDQFMRAKNGEISVMIGPRTALFTPFPDIGLIVIDEEHESSYKSDSMPKFHARETAVQLSKMHGASVVLGSATPSMEAYYRADKGEYKLLTLSGRVGKAGFAATRIVDMRKELREGNRTIFGRVLREAIADRLARKEQIMLFINRRGYAGFVSCRECGHVMKCPHCDVSLTEHKNGRLVCHYCGFEMGRVTDCPACGSKYISGFKVGTEQVEELLQKEFTGARVLRMDADTTRKKDAFDSILQAFSNEEADILVGTQMIVKGHDFKKVTLVGILAADLSLAAGDYRAPERTFQLLTQAAGRAGRSSMPGEVIIQTYQPEHYAVRHAAAQDYEAFYSEEMAYRELMGYPPAAHMLAVLLTGLEEERLIRTAAALSDRSKSWGMERKLLVLGPARAGIGKINDYYRQVIYLKHPDESVLIQAKDRMEKFMQLNADKVKQINIYFDFDPVNGY